MEFVPLRSLQRGLPEVWQTLRNENGRIVLTNKGQPAYLLVDLVGQNVISLINLFDKYREQLARPVTLTPQQKEAAQNFLSVVKSVHSEGLSEEDKAAFADLDSGKYKLNLSRELKL